MMMPVTLIKRRSILAAAGIGIPLLARSAAPVSLGLSLPMTGLQGEIAKDLLAGYQIALKGSPLEIVVLDDESKPDLTAANIKKFAGNPAIIATSGLVGTPHAQAALPVAVKGGLPVVGIRSGAQSLRTGVDGVYHLRSSFEDELEKLAAFCAGAGYRKMAILFSEDQFGTGSRDHLTAKLKDLGIGILSSVGMARNGENLDQATAKVAADVKATTEPVGIALLLILKPMTNAVQSLRLKHQLITPLLAMSFVATKSFSVDPNPALRSLGLISAFPLPRVSQYPLAVQFRSDAEKNDRTDLFQSITAFEGYFYGRVLAQAVATGKTRETLVRTLSAGVSLPSQAIQFDQARVGYRYLQIIRKDAYGLLRA